MVPDPEQKAASEQAQSTPARGPRRSRRGGRRHPRSRGPRPPVPAADESVAPKEKADDSVSHESEGERERGPERPDRDRVIESERASKSEEPLKAPTVSNAIEQVNQVIDQLRHALEEMEDVLSDTDWRVERFIGAEEPIYFAVIRKK